MTMVESGSNRANKECKTLVCGPGEMVASVKDAKCLSCPDGQYQRHNKFVRNLRAQRGLLRQPPAASRIQQQHSQ